MSVARLAVPGLNTHWYCLAHSPYSLDFVHVYVDAAHPPSAITQTSSPNNTTASAKGWT
jgi:hypothetical protein